VPGFDGSLRSSLAMTSALYAIETAKFVFTNSNLPGFDGSLRSPLAMTIVGCALETVKFVIVVEVQNIGDGSVATVGSIMLP